MPPLTSDHCIPRQLLWCQCKRVFLVDSRERFLDGYFPLEVLCVFSKGLGKARLCFLSHSELRKLIKILNEAQEVCWSDYSPIVFKICCFVCKNKMKSKPQTQTHSFSKLAEWFSHACDSWVTYFYLLMSQCLCGRRHNWDGHDV